MNRIRLSPTVDLALILVLTTFSAIFSAAVSPRDAEAQQEMASSDALDPTSAVLPEVVGQEAWDKFDKEWTKKLAPTVQVSEPIPVSGPETAGSTIFVVGKEVQLPSNVYITRRIEGVTCDGDPYEVCGATPWYELRRLTGALEFAREYNGEILIAAGVPKAWYGMAVPPEHRESVHDAYIGLLNSVGIPNIEDHGYIPVDPEDVVEKNPSPEQVATANAQMGPPENMPQPPTTPGPSSHTSAGGK